MTFGQPFVGTDEGPSMLRERGLCDTLTGLGWKVEDLPELNFHVDVDQLSDSVDPPNARNCSLVAHASKLVADLVETKLREGNFPLILGGDHSVAIGSLTGILRVIPDIGIIWVDAHADLNTPAISGSGNMHGMPLGLLLDHPEETAVDFSKMPGFEFLIDGPRISPDQIVYVGLRDIDPIERIWIKKLGIKAFTMHDIDHYGIGQVMDKAFAHLQKDNPNRPLHLSYDIDAVDPILAPATGTKVRGGLTFREAHFVAESVAQSGNLVSAEIVELNPTLSDDDGVTDTVALGEGLIASFMGNSLI
jgi:arginase